MRVTGGLRAVAILEAAKGTVVLLVGLGLLSIGHDAIERFAERLVTHAHLNPAARYSDIFIYLASRLHGIGVSVLAFAAFLYAGIRLAEAYGLWRERRWAEWLAAWSGGIYIPFELYELSVRVTWLKVGALFVNVAIVAFMLYSLSQSRRGNS